MTNRLELNWKLDGFIDEQRYYCSETPIDPLNPPAPKALLAGDVRTYTDTAIEAGKTYYVAVSSVKGSIEKVSQVIEVVAGGDPHWDKVVALLHFDGNLTDETGITWSANNNPAYDTGVFNNAIKLQSSSKQCVYSSNGIADFGSSDFTVEFFINFQSFNAEACVLTGGWNYSAGKRTWGFLLGGGSMYNQMHFYCSSNGSTSYICSIITSSLSVNTTYHVAAVREGSTFRLFLNGMLVGTSTSNASIYADLSSGVTVGSYSQSEMDSSYYVDAWFDELRITKGVARYTENFTPPDAPFPNY